MSFVGLGTMVFHFANQWILFLFDFDLVLSGLAIPRGLLKKCCCVSEGLEGVVVGALVL